MEDEEQKEEDPIEGDSEKKEQKDEESEHKYEDLGNIFIFFIKL